MPTKQLYLDKEATEPITINHGLNWRNLTITKDGELMGQVENVKNLKEGKSFQLSENRIISIQLKSKFGFIQELEILLNGKPIPGSGTEPNQQVKQVYQLLLFVAIFNIILGIIAEFAHINFFKSMGMGYGTIFIGLINGLLSYLIKVRLSLEALYTAIGLMILDTILTLVFAAKLGSNPTTGLMMKAIFIFILLNGVSALKKVRTDIQDTGRCNNF